MAAADVHEWPGLHIYTRTRHSLCRGHRPFLRLQLYRRRGGVCFAIATATELQISVSSAACCVSTKGSEISQSAHIFQSVVRVGRSPQRSEDLFCFCHVVGLLSQRPYRQCRFDAVRSFEFDRTDKGLRGFCLMIARIPIWSK